MRDNKAAGDDDAPGDVGRGWSQTYGTTDQQHIQNQSDPNISLKVTMTALKKTSKATNVASITQSVSSHMLTQILRRQIERKIKDIVEGDQFGFKEEKELRMQMIC